MNILLILGNGFDLNLGLPTSYSHFYNYYLSLETVKSVIKEEIEKKSQDWADLEKKLGEISQSYSDENLYIEDIDNLVDSLTVYLKAVDGLEIPNISNISTKMYEDIIHFPRYLDYKLKDEMRAFVESVGDSQKDEVSVKIMTFNYTSSIEKIVRL